MNDKTCWDCAFFSKERHACLRTRTPTLSTDSCSHWVSELPVCDMRTDVPAARDIYNGREQ